jgi:hypothetical protein
MEKENIDHLKETEMNNQEKIDQDNKEDSMMKMKMNKNQ